MAQRERRDFHNYVHNECMCFVLISIVTIHNLLGLVCLLDKIVVNHQDCTVKVLVQMIHANASIGMVNSPGAASLLQSFLE